jgi:fluoride ion exporter CrcB/FEX
VRQREAAQGGHVLNAFAYALGSVTVCLLAVFVGVFLAQKIF